MDDNHRPRQSRQGAAAFLAAQLAEQKFQYEEKIAKYENRIGELEAILEQRDSDERRSRIKRRKKVVVLVHGIRDRALWQSQVRASLRSAGLEVALTNYDRFDLARFLIPLPIFRNAIVENIRGQIRLVQSQNPHSDISVVAHSFGTYIISRVMSEEFDIYFDRIIFCGGVYSNKIQFEQFSNRFKPPILNEIGVKDYWPALANSVTWGYGSPGTFGSRRPLFEDRWHKDAGHSYFLSAEFCSEYWVPFIRDGVVKNGEDAPAQPHWMVRLIGTWHIKYIFLLMICVLFFAYFYI